MGNLSTLIEALLSFLLKLLELFIEFFIAMLSLILGFARTIVGFIS